MCLTFTLGWLKQSPKNRHKNRKYIYIYEHSRTRPFHTFAPFGRKAVENESEATRTTAKCGGGRIHSSEYLWATKVAFVLYIPTLLWPSLLKSSQLLLPLCATVPSIVEILAALCGCHCFTGINIQIVCNSLYYYSILWTRIWSSS